jgi:hypothetical protein
MAFKMYGKSPMTKKLVGKKSPNRFDPVKELENKIQGKKPKVSYDDAYKNRDMKTYGGLNKEDYIKEAKNQKSGGKVPKKPMTSKSGGADLGPGVSKPTPKKEATIKAPNTKKSLTTTTKSKLAVDGTSKKNVMEGKKTLGDTKLGNVKVGKNGKRLADTKVGKAFSKGRAKGVAARQARAERMAAAKAERKAKRDAKNNKK